MNNKMLVHQQHEGQGGRVMAKNENFLSVREAAVKLGVTLRWVYDMLYSGRLKAEQHVGRWRIPRSEIEARLKRRGQ